MFNLSLLSYPASWASLGDWRKTLTSISGILGLKYWQGIQPRYEEDFPFRYDLRVNDGHKKVRSTIPKNHYIHCSVFGIHQLFHFLLSYPLSWESAFALSQDSLRYFEEWKISNELKQYQNTVSEGWLRFWRMKNRDNLNCLCKRDSRCKIILRNYFAFTSFVSYM